MKNKKLKPLQSFLMQTITQSLDAPLPDLSSWIKEDSKMPASKRMEIYKFDYWYRILESLQEDFPSLYQKWGEVLFHKKMKHYLLKYPPFKTRLESAGEQVEHWILRYESKQKERLLSLVGFDQKVIQVKQAPSLPAMDFNPLQSAAALMKVSLRLQPWVRVGRFQYLWDFKTQKLKYARQGFCVLFYRQDLTVYHRKISEPWYFFLGSLQKKSWRLEPLLKRIEKQFDATQLSLFLKEITPWLTEMAQKQWFAQMPSLVYASKKEKSK